MHWLLLIVRYLLRTFSDLENGVSLAARIDGRIEQRRWGLGEESGWSPLANWRRRDHGERPWLGLEPDRPRSPGRSSNESSPGRDD
jgi:hypothetical protein